MTLAPESRVLLTDALRPPAGHRLDVAVGTTYSLNLSALLLAPLSFALFDMDDAEHLEKVHPVRLLEAARRYADHTTVFCQAGGIHVPTNYRSILTFVEGSVLEVMPPHEDAIFHPKIWALRFVTDSGEHRHRFVILSRNMTLDRSWDTALVLDEDDEGTIDAAPAADFVSRMPDLALRSISRARVAEIRDLARTLKGVRLVPPEPFTGGELLPIGLTDDRVWPFPQAASKLLAISPFLSRGALRNLGGLSTDRVLVSRAESLDLVGSRVLDGWDVNVLQRSAEAILGEDADGTEEGRAAAGAAGRDGFLEEHDGLHAKTFILDLAHRESMVVTGSANLTSETWGTSVEFDAVLTGPTARCGVEASLGGTPGAPGLSQLLQGYEPETTDGVDDAAIETSRVLERFHQLLASGEPSIYVATIDENTVDAAFVIELPAEQPGVTSVWPVSLPKDAHAQPLAKRLKWTMSGKSVTPFIGVETTYGEGDAQVTRRCVLKATLMGAVDGRRSDAVFDILKSKDDVLRYLMFLLGDPSLEQPLRDGDREGGEWDWSSAASAGTNDVVALFEPLVRATGRDEDALARVASLVAELRDNARGEDLVPDQFDELWEVVWSVHQEARR